MSLKEGALKKLKPKVRDCPKTTCTERSNNSWTFWLQILSVICEKEWKLMQNYMWYFMHIYMVYTFVYINILKYKHVLDKGGYDNDCCIL